MERQKWSWKSALTRRLVVPVVVAGVIVSVAAYKFAGPAHAAATASALEAAAPPLDSSSVGPLLSLDQAMEALTARVRPAVVNVTVTSKVGPQSTDDDQQQQEQQQQQMQQFFGLPFGQFFNTPQQRGPEIEHGLGSGVIISPNGYIVTNNHVIKGATDIRVTMTDRRIYPAKLIGADPLTDLAVIKINGTDLPSVPWGDSTALKPGQTVLAFGNPYGFSFTVTRGIVSALHRPNPEADRRKPGEFIQTDAAINPGNSGGALVNARGELIGINTFLISPSGTFSGMGFAIPSEIVQPTVEKLIQYGKVDHGFIGISISDVTPDNAKFFDVQKATGAVVTDVSADAPGDKAGLKTGDVITELDGKPVTDAGELQMEVGQKQPGDTIHLQVVRDGKPMSISVTLQSMKGSSGAQASGEQHGKARWGIGLGDLTPALREQMQLPANVYGAVIENVKSGSPADNAGLQAGDVIEQVNRKPMHSAAEIAGALSGIQDGQDALVLVWSGGGQTFRVLHPAEAGND
ncbi:Do family serine endopeptidase [Paracidobacterium acidisoli]|uniref:Do family serine endopeptidase n=1 Tax=Paracidobacterium acidisoli TaxID=2303751 RepID=A0A372INC2_9BACT|nr:Do family serine endopeptidase [Paracidobacterium acidisoli]MBT9332076.1 Do family serine endopeptidase [Paracidobacterium acidisoli]